MPELPEVETVARDLRPLITGATIVDATTLWARTLRDVDPEAFADGVAGRRIEAVGRRGEAARRRAVRRRVPDDPPEDDGPAVRRAAGRPRGSVRPARPRARGRPRDPVPRHPQVRPGRAVRCAGRRRSVRGDRPGAAVGRVHGRGVPAAAARPEGPPQAAPARPDVRRRRRQHLRRRGALGGAPPPAPDGPDAAAPRRAAPLDRDPAGSSRRRSIRRGSSIDDYTAPDGDGEMQEHLAVYQRTGEPCLRCGRPIRRIVVGGRATHFCSWCQRLPAARSRGCPGDPARRCPCRSGGRRWTELPGGEGSVGPAAERSATPPARARGADPPGGRDRAGRRPAPRSGAGRCRSFGWSGSAARSGRSSSSTTSLRRSRSATGSGSSGRTAPARRRCSGSRPAATSPTAATVHRKRGLTLGLLAQESHFDAAFMAAPDLRAAVRHGAAHLEAMAERARRAASATAASRSARYADLQHEFEVLGGYTAGPAGRRGAVRPRLHARRVGASRRPRCRAASRRGPRSPGSSSPSRTCCSSTSRRTTSTSARSSGSRSTSGVGAARCSSPPTTGRSSTRP